MPPAPTISVLIPAFNRERFIGPCIESILGQTYQDFKILVYDDGSAGRE
jgi:glycosyltransferase involved in cell wall biosynthesis